MKVIDIMSRYDSQELSNKKKKSKTMLSSKNELIAYAGDATRRMSTTYFTTK